MKNISAKETWNTAIYSRKDVISKHEKEKAVKLIFKNGFFDIIEDTRIETLNTKDTTDLKNRKSFVKRKL